MFRNHRITRRSVEETLRALPPDVTVYIVGGTYFVVAPTGLFVVAENTVDLSAAASAAAIEAERIRADLQQAVPFVPFVDAIAVGDATTNTDSPALIVPPDLVMTTLLGGPRVIDDQTLEALRQLHLPVLY